MKRVTGNYLQIGQYNYFIPGALPPKNPPLILEGELAQLYSEVVHDIARLNEMAQHIPNAARFIKAYILKEALLSSAIENIHTTLLDIYTQPFSGIKPTKETQLVLNYKDSLDAAVYMIRDEQMPITSRVILQAHRVLMDNESHAGTFRKQPVRVGDLIPAPAQEIPTLMAELEIYINVDDSLPPLIKAGLAHVQFETIHPFLDGNGRIGRLLIVLILIENQLLTTPVLYPSYAFKKHQMEYYRQLDRVRTHGDFEGWITFYLHAMQVSAVDAYSRTMELHTLDNEIRNRIATDKEFTRIQESANRALTVMFDSPVITVKLLAEKLELSYNTAAKLINLFVNANILHEMTGYKRNKMYQFKPYLEILDK